MHFVFLSNFDVLRMIKYFPSNVSTMVNITWSVSIEEQFYLVWPLFFFFIPTKFYKFIFPCIIAFSLYFRFLHVGDYAVTYFHTFSVINDLAIGGYGAYLSIYNTRFMTYIRQLGTQQIAIIYFIGFTMLLFQNLTVETAPTFGIFERIFNSAFFIFIILEQNFAHHSFKKFSDWNFLAGFGTITYGLYLLHPICIHVIDALWPFLNLKMKLFYEMILKGIAALALSILVCKLSYRYYERYFLKFKEHFVFIKTHPV
jgi:peptidoglycan/LPS O-acetylase OafA/YrhL